MWPTLIEFVYLIAIIVINYILLSNYYVRDIDHINTSLFLINLFDLGHQIFGSIIF